MRCAGESTTTRLRASEIWTGTVRALLSSSISIVSMASSAAARSRCRRDAGVNNRHGAAHCPRMTGLPRVNLPVFVGEFLTELADVRLCLPGGDWIYLE